MVASAILNTLNSYSNRLIRVVTVLVDLHLDIAMQEAAWEKKRLTSGFILLSIGGGLMAMSGLLLHVIAIWFAQTLLQSWIGAIAIVLGFDFVVGSLFLLAASRKLQGPYMVQTQARLARTSATLFQSEPDSD